MLFAIDRSEKNVEFKPVVAPVIRRPSPLTDPPSTADRPRPPRTVMFATMMPRPLPAIAEPVPVV